uniref:Odorant receptor n=1 Tax=Conogethes punctiferalis TaxID=1133088 RepID=A0A1Y9TKA6_CONPF|nr:odorant receptor 53 [Conogethes punctiferalis]
MAKSFNIINRADFTFKEVFFITEYAMLINRSHPFIKRNLFWLFQYLIIFTLSISASLLLINSILFYDIPSSRYTDASKNGTMAIVALTVTIKHAFLLYYQADIKNLINIVNKDYELALNFETVKKEIVMKYAKRGKKVTLFWLVAAAVTSIVFPANALLKMAKTYWHGAFEFIPMFELQYPDCINAVKDTPTFFYLLFVYNFLFGFYATTVYIGFDPLAPIFLLHICGQLDILSYRMLTLFDDAEVQDVNVKLKFINMKLQDLYSLVNNIKSMFTVLFEFNMKTSTFLLPLSLFQVTESLKEKQLNVEFFSIFAATIMHFYMPCYYSDVLLERSDNLRRAIYFCGWEKQTNIRARKTILLMMTRTTAPLVLSTVFYPICLDTFAEMCRQSYAIFNIMNAAWA